MHAHELYLVNVINFRHGRRFSIIAFEAKYSSSFISAPFLQTDEKICAWGNTTSHWKTHALVTEVETHEAQRSLIICYKL